MAPLPFCMEECMKPVIGVMPLVDEEKDSIWMLPGYMDGISTAGGIPVMFPLTSDSKDISELLDKVDGILLTGGHDVAPALYGEKTICSSVIPCGQRDSLEQEVLKQALERDIPILGICRGIQFLNAYLGGTLYQDLLTQHSSDVEHHQKPPYDVPVHRVDIIKESSLYALLKVSSLLVNSYHHQAIKDLAYGLRAMAVSEDGLVEAVEIPEKSFVWAVQWHPEFSYKVDSSSVAIFNEFIKHCMDYQNHIVL